MKKLAIAIVAALYVVSVSAVACCARVSAGPAAYFPEITKTGCLTGFRKVTYGGSTRFSADAKAPMGTVRVHHWARLWYTDTDEPIEEYALQHDVTCNTALHAVMWHQTSRCVPCAPGYSYYARYYAKYYDCQLGYWRTVETQSATVPCHTY
jgi:hypothetical protein